MRLLLISLGVVGAVVVALAGLRFWGLSQRHQAFEHEFLESARPIIVLRADMPIHVRQAADRRADIAIWLNARTTADGRFAVIPDAAVRELLVEKSFPPGKWKGPYLTRYSLEELRPLFPRAVPLEDFFKEFPDRRFVVNVVDNVPGVDGLLVKTLEPYAPDGRVLIQSDTDVILRSVKALKPLWLYGTSWPDLTRLLSFESVGLLPATPFKGDVFIAPPRLLGRPAYNTAVLEEMRRRKKTILLGPLENETDLNEARTFAPDGYVIATPALLERLISF